MATAKRTIAHPAPSPRDVAALVRARGRIVSNVGVARWLEKLSKGDYEGYDASQLANKYVQDHPKGLAKGEKRGKRKKHCGVPRKPRAAKKTGAKKGKAKKAKSARANPRKRKPARRKTARRNPTPRKRRVSRAARAAAKRRIAKMPRDSKGRLKPKGARKNPRRSRTTTRRRSRR